MSVILAPWEAESEVHKLEPSPGNLLTSQDPVLGIKKEVGCSLVLCSTPGARKGREEGRGTTLEVGLSKEKVAKVKVDTKRDNTAAQCPFRNNGSRSGRRLKLRRRNTTHQ